MDRRLLKETDEQLRKIIKERIVEKKRREQEMACAKEALRRMQKEYYQYWDAVKEAKETLGAKKAKGCPALKKKKGGYQGSNEVQCLAKRYKYHSWCPEEMYREHCFACHLTPEQAKTAMMYDRILVGRREGGR